MPYTLLRVILRTLHIPLPLPPVPHAFSITGLGLSFGGSRPALGPGPTKDPKVAAERWIQSLEEETGCVSITRAQATEGEASGVASGSSSVLNRRQIDDSNPRVLPEFFIGSYESFARACGKESDPKIGCVVLVSEEHDDVAAFKRSVILGSYGAYALKYHCRTTLTDPDFVRLMHENNFLVWGGDIRDRDAWSGTFTPLNNE